MNIHVDEQTFLKLKQATLLSVVMGSRLYGCETDKSDTDILHIIATPSGWSNSLVWTHHNLQYKEEGTDHVFCTLQNFLRNILKGDSTLNYEAIFSEEFKECQDLQFIYQRRHEFNNYALLRAYLGLARRDLKQFSQSYDVKKMFHAQRGVWSFNQLLKKNYTNSLKMVDQNFWEKLMKIRNHGFSQTELIAEMRVLSEQVDASRKQIGLDFAEGKISRLMDVKKLQQLDQDLKKVCQTQWYQNRVLEDIELESIYASLETDIEYK